MIRVLVIEDDGETAAEIVEDFTSAGFAVDREITGPGGLRRAQTDSFDVISLDRMLPGMDGLTLLDRLRASECQDAGARAERPVERRRTHPRAAGRRRRLFVEAVRDGRTSRQGRGAGAQAARPGTDLAALRRPRARPLRPRRASRTAGARPRPPRVQAARVPSPPRSADKGRRWHWPPRWRPRRRATRRRSCCPRTGRGR